MAPEGKFLTQRMVITRTMFVTQALRTKLRNCGTIGVFALIFVLSVFCLSTNIFLSFFITSSATSTDSVLSKWIEKTWDLHIQNRRSIDLKLNEPTIGGMAGLVPGETYGQVVYNDSHHDAFKSSDSGAISTNLSSNIDMELPANNQLYDGVTGNGSLLREMAANVVPAVSVPVNPAHPWWWVDFKVQNETHLREVDNYLFSSAELHDFSLNVELEDIDNMKVTLPPLIPNMRNPCWLERIPDNFTLEASLYKCHINFRRIRKSYAFLTELFRQREMEGLKWRMRCFPAFFLIGVAKCGTTDLYEAMTQHPDIITSELKEPEYWSRQRYGVNPWLFQTECPAFKDQATFTDYLDTYDNSSEAVRRSFVRDAESRWHSDVMFGDYSTHTMEELFFWDRSQDEPRFITAHHIHNLNPKTKFIVIFRDPVERAYSRYKMRFKNRGNVAGTVEDFHQRMEKQVTGIGECLLTYKRRVCVYKENIGKNGDHTILVNGMYIVYLKDWLEVFPLEQFMVIRFEDYILDRLGHIEKITQFLELNPMPENEKNYIRNMPAANAGISIGGGMKNETITLLQDFFRPMNQELVELTGDDRFTWGY